MSDKNQVSNKSDRITLRIEPTLLEQAQQIADADERSLSYVFRKAIERCLPDMKKEVGLSS